MAKVIRLLKPGSVREVRLIDPREQGEDETDADYKAFQDELATYDDVRVHARMVKRSEMLPFSLEIERLQSLSASMEKRAKELQDSEDEDELEGLRKLLLRLDSDYRDFYSQAFDMTVDGVVGLQFVDDVTDEAFDSGDLERDDLKEMLLQCDLLTLVTLAALRANRLSDQKKEPSA